MEQELFRVALQFGLAGFVLLGVGLITVKYIIPFLERRFEANEQALLQFSKTLDKIQETIFAELKQVSSHVADIKADLRHESNLDSTPRKRKNTLTS